MDKIYVTKRTYYHVLNKNFHGLENFFYFHLIEKQIGYLYQGQRKGFWLEVKDDRL